MRTILASILLFLSGLQAVAESTALVVVRANEWAPAVQAWKQFRQQQGFAVIEVEPGDDFVSTQQRIEVALRNARSDSQFIFLLGDAPSFHDALNGLKTAFEIPTAYIDSKVVKNFGSEPTIATDFSYGDLDRDGTPEAIVGRFPASTIEQASSYLQRVVDYERRPRGSWQREIDIVAGIGDLGLVADTVVQGVSKKLLTEHIPPAYRLSLTHASTNSLHCPPLERFRENMLGRLNDGGLFWIYLGHGHPTRLDSIRVGDSHEPILDEDQVALVNIPHGPPIAVCLACYLGAYDVPCFAEQMLKQANGPIAAIAASRVTMPYGMGTLGSEMLRQYFVERRSRLGEVLHFAKLSTMANDSVENSAIVNETSKASLRQAMDQMAKALSPPDHSIHQERTEHAWLFNLLGDPTLSLRHPSAMKLDVPDDHEAGQRLSIRGVTPLPGILRVELSYPRTRIPANVRQLQLGKSSIDGHNQQQLIYEAANKLSCVVVEKPLSIGEFEVELPTDKTWRGNFEVHAIVEGADAWSAATETIQLRRAP
jgi:hypothetical protein